LVESDDLSELDSEFLLKIPVGVFDQSNIACLYNRNNCIHILESKYVKLLTQVFGENLLFSTHKKSEISFLLRLRIDKRWWPFSMSSISMFPYTEAMAGVLRNLAIKEFLSNEQNIKALRKYLSQHFFLIGIFLLWHFEFFNCTIKILL
jgi:hypothetical protein